MSTTILNIKDKPHCNLKLSLWDKDITYIGRENKWLGLEASKWANPYPMKKEADRPIVIRKCRDHVLSTAALMLDIRELKNKRLGCYCSPKYCHGNIYIEILELYDHLDININATPFKYATEFMDELYDLNEDKSIETIYKEFYQITDDKKHAWVNVFHELDVSKIHISASLSILTATTKYKELLPSRSLFYDRLFYYLKQQISPQEVKNLLVDLK